jgi:hypothetical protein
VSNVWDEIGKLIAAAIKAEYPPAKTAGITNALNGLQALAKQSGRFEMSAPTTPPDPTNPADQVSVSQSWLEFVAQTIVTANSVLGPYIQQLLAGEAVTIEPADVADVTSALSGLQGLEPAAPTPEPPTS